MIPKVSVVIPTYNRAELLHSAITSVLNQTFQDFEIIVVDDASKDNTRDVVKGFSDKRIRYIRHEVNKGEAGTRNTGIVNSKAEYIAFLDDDDEWLPEKLRLQVDLLENSPSKVGGVYSGLIAVDGTNGKILNRKIPVNRGDIYDDLLIKNLLGTPSTVLLRRECLERVGLFDESIAYGLDHDLWIRVSKHFHFEYIEEPLVKYLIHNDRLSNDPDIRAKGLEDMIRKYGKGILASNRKYYSWVYFSIGVLFHRRGDTKRALKAFLNSIKLNPFETRSYRGIGISLLGTNNIKRLKKIRGKLIAPMGSDRA